MSKHAHVIDRLQREFGDRVSRAETLLRQHGHDESYHPVHPPEAVVFPESTEEVSRIVRACARARCPIVPFGIGSSLEGHVAALESRVHMLSQRVDDIAQAHLRSVSAMGSPSMGDQGAAQLQAQAATINSLMQSQMMLTAKIDALANSVKMNESEGRMRMYLAAAGGAAAAMLALRLFDSQR